MTLVYEVKYSKNLHVRAQNMIFFFIEKILSLVVTDFLEFPENRFLLGVIYFLNAYINI